MDAQKSIVSFSFPGFLFGPFWLFYRKIFREGLMVAAAVFVVSAFGIFGQVMNEKVIEVLVNVVSLAVALAIGLFGNHLYRRHVVQQTALLDVAGQDPQVVRDRLAMQGGTSPGAVLGLLAVLFVANFIVFGLARTCCLPPVVPDIVTPITDPTPSQPADLVTNSPTPSDSSSATGQTTQATTSGRYNVCIRNDTPYDIQISVLPASGDTTPGIMLLLHSGYQTSWATDATANPDIAYDPDALVTGNTTRTTIVTALPSSPGLCAKTYSFTNTGSALSLSDAP